MAELRKERNKEDCIGSHLGPRLQWLPATAAMDNQAEAFLQKNRTPLSRVSERLPVLSITAKASGGEGG